MRKLFYTSLIAATALISCNSGGSYTVETFYSKGATGDTTLTSNKTTISADTDSLAYIKANDAFTKLMSTSGNGDGLPVKFTIRNSKGTIVTAPGVDKRMETEEKLYPNQKP